MLTIETSVVAVQRILHALRDVEQAVKQSMAHDPTVGIHEIAERVAILRLSIVNAFENETN